MPSVVVNSEYVVEPPTEEHYEVTIMPPAIPNTNDVVVPISEAQRKVLIASSEGGLPVAGISKEVCNMK